MPKSRQLPSALHEISGLARAGSGYVAVNDGGNAAELHVLDAELNPVRRIPVAVPNVDWEALTPSDGGYLVADVGDNAEARAQVHMYALRPDGSLVDSAALRYPDRPRNVEATYVRDGHLYVLTKSPVRMQGGGGSRVAYLYSAPLPLGSATLTLCDSLVLEARSVTDACVFEGGLAVLSYDVRLLLGVPLTRATLYYVAFDAGGGFRQNSLASRRIRAPFTPTQYEAVAPAARAGHVIVASERTAVVPPRWREVRVARRPRRS